MGASRDGPAFIYKVVQLHQQDGGRKAVRCWLPSGTGPVGDISEGKWAAEAVADFEQCLRAYRRDGDTGHGDE
jgi:hypothetical protein